MQITSKFHEVRSKGERALVLFVMAGDPSLGDLPDILNALEEGGADLIEVGIPFSDPIADGPVIQASSQAALDRGVTPIAVLECVSKVKIGVPLVAMGYYNTVLRMGTSEFASRLKSAGFAGSIITDLTAEEAADWKRASSRQSLDTVFLAAPNSTGERLDLVCAASSGFVYAVSRTGVTGSNVSVPGGVRDLVGKIKSRTEIPICVGFGISTPEHVRMVCEVADGAVVGSWLVAWLAKNWSGGKGRAGLVEKVKALKDATRSADA